MVIQDEPPAAVGASKSHCYSTMHLNTNDDIRNVAHGSAWCGEALATKNSVVVQKHLAVADSYFVVCYSRNAYTHEHFHVSMLFDHTLEYQRRCLKHCHQLRLV